MKCLKIFHVTDVWAYIRVATLGQTERGFQFSAHGEHGFNIAIESHGQWRITACAPDGKLIRLVNAHNRVVAYRVYVAVVKQERIDKRRQTRQRFVVLHADWFIAQVPRSHHQRMVAEKKMMQWRIREHEPEQRRTGCNQRGKSCVVLSPKQNDGALASRK